MASWASTPSLHQARERVRGQIDSVEEQLDAPVLETEASLDPAERIGASLQLVREHDRMSAIAASLKRLYWNLSLAEILAGDDSAGP